MKILQNILLEKYLSFSNKNINDLKPEDALILNRALYKAMTGSFYKENSHTFFLFENVQYSYIMNNNLIDNDRKNDFYSCFVEPGNNPEYDFAIPIEEYKYSTCEYMTDEEFENFEESIKDKKFYSLDDLHYQQKIVLNKSNLEKIKNVINQLDENSSVPEDSRLILKAILSLSKNQSYEKTKLFHNIIDGDEKERNKAFLLYKHDEFFFFLNRNENDIINNNYLIHKIKNKHNLKEEEPEKIIDFLKENKLFKSFIKNYKENELEVIKDNILKEEIHYVRDLIYSDIKNTIYNTVHLNKNFEDSIKNNNTQAFLNFLNKDIELKKTLTDDPLSQKVIENQLKEFKTQFFEVNHNYHKNISKLFDIQFDNIHDIYSSNNMKIIEKPDYDDTLKNKSFQIIATNQNQIVGGINMISGGYYNYKDFDYVMTGIATSSKYRNLKIAENLFRETLDYCVKNNKNMIRTKPTIDGNQKIYDKFTKISKEEKYSNIIIVHSEEEYSYKYIQQKNSEFNGNKESLDNAFKQIRKIKEEQGDYPDNDSVNKIIKAEINKKNKNRIRP